MPTRSRSRTTVRRSAATSTRPSQNRSWGVAQVGSDSQVVSVEIVASRDAARQVARRRNESAADRNYRAVRMTVGRA